MISKKIPRLPLKGNIDLTYRCNNYCRHCWISVPARSPVKNDELTFHEIRRIVDEARSLGCREWAISGGEPMLHPEFEEIFDYITKKSVTYSLNTNGTLITPEIARFMVRKGNKMVALYGATADVHDHITRTPGSFTSMMRGCNFLKDANAAFTVQIVPMRDNFHQYDAMIEIARSLSPYRRIGASWLYCSASGDFNRNTEIRNQRLTPQQAVFLESPEPYQNQESEICARPLEDNLFSACTTRRREFYINPYGKMTFCGFIKDPELYYDLRMGSVQDAWDNFIPGLAGKVKATNEYQRNCGTCLYRDDCRWCPAFGYLEYQRYSAPIVYLCDIARETKLAKETWSSNHRRYYSIAGITIEIVSDIPITDATFQEKFKKFETSGPGNDTIRIRHHFYLPEINEKNLGKLVYKKSPWAIYHKGSSWIYLSIEEYGTHEIVNWSAVFNQDHSRGQTYNSVTSSFLEGQLPCITLFSTDQIPLARALADREACFFHAAGMIFHWHGVLFVGHSGAGKSTTVTMLKDHGKILCDDRIAVRRWPEGFKIHGTWSHGDVAEVSNASAPLSAIFFLEKADFNEIQQIKDKKEILSLLPFYVVRPLATADWWEKTLDLIGKIASEIPVYRLKLDKSGKVKDILEDLFKPK